MPTFLGLRGVTEIPWLAVNKANELGEAKSLYLAQAVHASSSPTLLT